MLIVEHVQRVKTCPFQKHGYLAYRIFFVVLLIFWGKDYNMASEYSFFMQ